MEQNKKVSIHQVFTGTLSCEPIVRRTANGELLCVCECDGPCEPHPDNRVYCFHSKDNGKTWSEKRRIYPEDGQAVCCTELLVNGEEITAFIAVHTGYFLDWKCYMMKSFDNGYTWKNYGTVPGFPEYALVRSAVFMRNGQMVLPYQFYPVTWEEHDRIMREETRKHPESHTQTEYCESGVLISKDGGKTYEHRVACRMNMRDRETDYKWIWSEPTIVEAEDDHIIMLMRVDGTQALWRCDSWDGGETWDAYYKTDIINPSNKPKLIALDNGRIALIHTPSTTRRYPLELWISDDHMKTWAEKRRLTDFPGSYNYSDGVYENGHILFTVEHNRHTILLFDVEV